MNMNCFSQFFFVSMEKAPKFISDEFWIQFLRGCAMYSQKGIVNYCSDMSSRMMIVPVRAQARTKNKCCMRYFAPTLNNDGESC